MMIALEENPTRQKIIMLLNKKEHMTVAEMSKAMGITPMAVRQHLMSLEKRGIIKYVAKKYGIGRPVFQYSLTKQAREIFPKGYGEFAKDVLKAVQEMDGRKKVEKIFKVRKDWLFKEKSNALASCNCQKEKLNLLAELLDNAGYMVEVEANKKDYYLKQYNCLLSSISDDYPEACKYELELYRNLLGPAVTRSECQRDGAPSCTYVVPRV